MATTPTARCECSATVRRRYLQRLSGPLLDRVDIQVHVLPVTRAALSPDEQPEASASVAARVRAARAAQQERWAGTGWLLNAHAPGTSLRRAPGGARPT
ncbi:hypothetical protein GCM10025868_08470 [Angustibacter aerolatus]|uniref:Uncharacterized protein n=1 Tax=Angustibacter aerolatus TaxID=1162965 RepID=A0ABQ6JCV5_9ACTN|nr:ATP-binding protein [Angustibacter aerolatus]GMA85597.1 hypothetical protein GCM10025868_08470 [Angustibacter aerolatus]